MSLKTYVPGGPLPKVSASDYLFDRDNAIRALRLHFVLAAANGSLLEAATAHANAQALRGIPADDPTMPQFQKTVEYLQSARSLSARALIGDSGSWKHTPYFRTFTLANIDGVIHSAYLACTGHVRSLDYAPEVRWTIPTKWEGCSLTFAGEPGTTFNIVEFREPPVVEPASDTSVQP